MPVRFRTNRSLAAARRLETPSERPGRPYGRLSGGWAAMTGSKLPRRDVLRTAGTGLLGLAAASTTGTVSGHESYETSAEDRLPATLISADPESGFHYPYFLYAPKRVVDASRPILVEPNNTGRTTDDFGTHLDYAADFVEHGNARTLSEAVTVPLLVPVFPRPMTEPVDGDHYVHALDTDTMAIDSGPLERVDLQLLRMVDHARDFLSEISYRTEDEILLNGFSASGNFVNRFTALHPDRVRVVTAGAVNGTAILPVEEAKGHALNYQIGVADLEELTGEPFDLEAFREVDQFIYMGAEDENDTIPYTDAWNDDEREIALDVYGEDMQEDRMPYCESVYDEVGASAEFRLYDGVEHRTTPDIMADLVDVHRRNVGLSRVEFAGPPGRGETSVAVSATASSDSAGTAFELRAFGESNEELTEAPVPLESEASTDAHLELARELEAEEAVTVAILESGTTDPERAVASARSDAVDTARVRFASQPAAGDTEVTLEYAIESGYRSESAIHVYVAPAGERRSFLGTLGPGSSGTEPFDADTDESGVPFEAGETLEVRFVDIDRDETLASAEATVEEGSLDDSATVAFADHPLHDATTVGLEYSLHEEYEVSTVARLQLQSGENPPLLLGRIEPGDAGTETFSIGNYPMAAATDATVSVVDETPLASDEATVLVREPGCECDAECDCEGGADGSSDVDVTPTFTYRPSEPSAGELVTFDATESTSTGGELLSYVWRFGDGTTAAGERVSHVFDDANVYGVRLEVVDDGGDAATVEERVRVATDPTAESPDADDGPDEGNASDENDASDDGVPGFGPIAGIAGLTGAGYLLKGPLLDDDEPEASDDR